MIIQELIAILGYDLRGEGDLDRFNRGLARTERNMAAFAAAAARWGTIVGTAIGGGIAFLGKQAISVSAQFETFEATLTTIEGSSEKAKKALSWITNFAATTPYEMAEVTEAFVRLRSYGMDPMDGSLRAIGDAGSAMGKSMMQGVEAIADAATFSFERLKEFGVTTRTEGDKVTFSWTENGKTMTETVKKQNTEITNFLVRNFNRYAGAMDMQSRTWKGMVSNLSDQWSQFLLKIGQSGLFDRVKDRLSQLLAQIQKWEDDGTLAKWAERISRAFIALANALEFILDRILTHGDALLTWLGKIDPNMVYALGAAFAALMIWLFPTAWAFAAIVAALEDFATWLEGGESMFGQLVDWIKGVTGASDALAASLAGVVAALGLLIAIKPFGLLKTIGRLFAGGGAATVAGGAAPAAAAAGGGWLPWIIGSVAKLSPYLAMLATPGSTRKLDPNNEYDAKILQLQAEARDRAVDEYTAIKGYDRSPGPSTRGGRRGSGSGRVRSRTDDILGGTGEFNGARDGDAGDQSSGVFMNMLSNMNANLAKMTSGAAAGAVITDARTDARSFPVNVSAPVTVNVTQAVEAPGAVGAAVAGAVGDGAVAGAARVEKGPAF